MRYRLDRNLDDFPASKELKGLILRAIDAANRGKQFDQTIDTTLTDGPILCMYN